MDYMKYSAVSTHRVKYVLVSAWYSVVFYAMKIRG